VKYRTLLMYCLEVQLESKNAQDSRIFNQPQRSGGVVSTVDFESGGWCFETKPSHKFSVV
jgi:hypothetical protein